MIKYIIMFVLAMLVVKINVAQSPFYYDNSEQIPLTETDDKLLIRLVNFTDTSNLDSLQQKILSDSNFTLISPVNTFEGEYYLLQKNTGATITTSAAIANYLTASYVSSASFIFTDNYADVLGLTNEILVKPFPDVSEVDLENMVNSIGGMTIQQDDFDANVYHLFCSKSNSMSSLEIANELFETGNFEFAQPNFYLTLQLDCVTTDYNWSAQWALQNNGLNTSQWGGTSGEDIKACNAWNYTKGSGVKVAVVDEGIDLTHPDFTFASGYDATGLGSAGGCNPADGHGTCSAGVIGAKQNTVSVSGVAPECTIMPVRMGYGAGLGLLNTTMAWLANSINWAYQNGADVISNSWGAQGPIQVIDNAVANAVKYGRNGRGCVITFGTGNGNNVNWIWPTARYPDVIGVGASNMCQQRKSYTSCDGESWGSNYSTDLDVVAPGVKIYTTDNMGTGGYVPGPTFATFNGTSAACPHVSGIAALLLAVNPCLRQKEVREIIELSADKIGSYTYTTSSTHPNGSWNDEMGYGRVNAEKAVVLAYNLYKQNKTETGTMVYSGMRRIFSGTQVSNILPTGDYTVSSGATIVFYAPTEINLEPGFSASAGSTFIAKINSATPCVPPFAHYKQGEALGGSGAATTKSSKAIINLYPNPADDELNILFELPAKSPVLFQISDLLGRVIKNNKTEGFEKGQHFDKIAIYDLASGVYIFKMRTNFGQNQIKFIKK